MKIKRVIFDSSNGPSVEKGQLNVLRIAVCPIIENGWENFCKFDTIIKQLEVKVEGANSLGINHENIEEERVMFHLDFCCLASCPRDKEGSTYMDIPITHTLAHALNAFESLSLIYIPVGQ